MGAQPLWSEFRDLYAVAVDPNLTVADALSGPSITVHFRRELNGPEWDSFATLSALVATVSLSQGADTVTWHLNAFGQFLVKSLYHKLCQGSVQLAAKGLWKA